MTTGREGYSQHPHAGEHDHAHAGHGHEGHSHDDEHQHSHEADPGTEYTWRVHHPYGDERDEVAVEVAPKSGLLPRWRFVTPGDYKGIVRWGVGAPNGAPVNTAVRSPVEGGPVRLVNGPEVLWMGGLEALSSKKSAYLVFKGEPPHYVAFGQAEDPHGPPGALEGVSFGEHPEHPPQDSHFG